ncbi:hypothetical protein DF105_03750 [Burkholderia stagnalis]|nr:hypothetical protein DF164_16585 [Burkholderia stagnalis]RQQ21953.1 hypothetical protein DF163_31065 [Burkholderia stagnalis]RQQ23803.1 hypothetical protein DF149_30120 [Burkholderia stagnalis]RQQ35643.1 hypothetical protein DF148_13900 [Burkholderia stagnalis]RQQ52029.1 hypothetical protein DF162_09360 [Burkholderia stagnalis]
MLQRIDAMSEDALADFRARHVGFVSLSHQHFDAFDGIANSYFLADPQTGALTVFVVPRDGGAEHGDRAA